MTTRHFRSGRRAELPLVGKAVAAVDLGFGASKTCGIALSQGDREPRCSLTSFGGCVAEITRLINDRSLDALIIEAPLSGIFDAGGDPSWRIPFEQRSVAGTTERRYWYLQPGSTVCLAAIAFLQRLETKLAPAKKSVALFEGFFTFKLKVKSDHCKDALRLLAAAQTPESGVYYDVVAPKGGHLLTTLGLTGLTSASAAAPAVIACRL